MLIHIFILLNILSCALSPLPGQRTTKNKDLVIFNGFEMRKKELICNGMTQVWGCVKRSCPGRAHSPTGSTELVEKTPHNHLPNADLIKVRERVESAKDVATNSNLAPREIIGKVRENLDDSALLRMPSYSAVRQREIPGATGVDKKELQNVVLNGEFTLDKNGNRFLLVDSRADEPGAPVFFIFCADTGLARLKKYKKWSGDGTFKVSPPNFLQIYTVNTLIGHVSIPSAYILMSNRQAQTYGRAFTVLKNQMNNEFPQSFLTDFEESAKIGFHQAFGDEITVKHCLFHLAQAVHRKVQKEGLSNNYFSTYVFRMVGDELRDPLFHPNRWNQHNSVIFDEQRTNNGIEGFIKAMKDEEEYQNNRVRPFEIDQTRGIADRPRLKKYIENDSAIRQLVIAYDAKEEKNDDDLIRHIHALQYRLGMKGFEAWD